MKEFLGEDFLLNNAFAVKLYHDFAKDTPIIDYHSHLSPQEIAEDKRFINLTEIWLKGDHYKWRAMRANGIAEDYITGNKPDAEKFQKWAETVPNTVRNPLFHWTHLELKRYFGVEELLTGENARRIYEHCNELLQTPAFSTRSLLKKMKVKMVGTTDHPLDDLSHHKKIKDDDFGIRVLPTFRPDAFLAIENPDALLSLISSLSEATGLEVTTFQQYLDALKVRHDYFGANGCKMADHGLSHLFASDFTVAEVEAVFSKLLHNSPISTSEGEKFKSALLYYFSIWNHEKGWVQQYHLGALRNNNTRLLTSIGADAGLDSIGDFEQGVHLSKFLDRLDRTNSLAKTILYNLNPRDNDLFATMVGNFNDGTVAGKMQYGAAWWFLDQKQGIIDQLNAVSNMGLLKHFIGMLTDSRSFLSYPRHEYFRRILCNLIGEDVVNGELPNDLAFFGRLVQDVCYQNAKNYFNE